MNKTIITLLATASFALIGNTPGNNGGGNGGCGVGQTTNGCGISITTPSTPATNNVGPLTNTNSNNVGPLINALDNTNSSKSSASNNLNNANTSASNASNNVGPLTNSSDNTNRNTLDNRVNASANTGPISNKNTAFGGDGGDSVSYSSSKGGNAYVGPVSSENTNNATGGVASATTGPVTSTNVNSIDARGGTASATTGPVNSNSASNSNQSQSTANANNSSVNVEGDQYRAAASTAYAPQLVTGSDTCMGSSSAGGQGIGFGFSLGTSWTDKNCVRLKNSRQLQSMGQNAAAIQLMCQDPEVRTAMLEAGTPCAPAAQARRRK
jgi:hypothetical protein